VSRGTDLACSAPRGDEQNLSYTRNERPLCLASVRDFRAEGWASMDLCADQLLTHLAPGIDVEDVAPEFHRVFGWFPAPRGIALNADRLLNRHFFLPNIIRRIASRHDFVHIVDHSYAHLVLSVPPGRAGVYCHDLDAFRCLLEPDSEPRPRWFRQLAQRTMEGLGQAAVVFHSTVEVRDRILRHKLVDAASLVHAPYGVAAEFTSEPAAPMDLPIPTGAAYLLHVGSNIPRKRLDVVLDVFAAVRLLFPELRLVQVGGPWPANLAERIEQLGVGSAVIQLRGLNRLQLAELYRGAAIVLITSEAEGFGLPVIESLACGTAVVASDIPVLREVGGAVVDYCAVGDVRAWTEMVVRVIGDSMSCDRKNERIERAGCYSWNEHARIIGNSYVRLAAELIPKCEFSS
jgi:glycosyltransferase involved in cell wall biosynthesis